MVEALNRLEAAKIAKEEYIDGTYVQELEQVNSEIFVAEEDLRRAQEYVVYSQRLAARGYVTSQQLEGDEFAVEKAATDLKVAKTKLKVLQEYTKRKTLKILESDIRTAESDWKSAESSYKLELSELAVRRNEAEVAALTAEVQAAQQKVAARSALLQQVRASAEADIHSAQASLRDAEGAAAATRAQLARAEQVRQDAQLE